MILLLKVEKEKKVSRDDLGIISVEQRIKMGFDREFEQARQRSLSSTLLPGGSSRHCCCSRQGLGQSFEAVNEEEEEGA